MDGIATLMLPDYANCHEWGYDHYAGLSSGEGALIQAHMAADWVVHFGPLGGQPRMRTGWAYRRMGIAARRYKDFFTSAQRQGLRESAEPNDSVRGFSHSMIEYCVDTYLCHRGALDRHFASIQEGLARNVTVETATSVLAMLGAQYDRRSLGVSLTDYRARAIKAQSPEELAYYAAARKFGLRVDRDSLPFVGAYLEAFLHELDVDELEAVCVHAASAVRSAVCGTSRPSEGQ